MIIDKSLYHQDKGSVIKLSTKRVNEDQINDVEIKIRKKRTAKTPQVAEQFRIKTTGDVKVKSKALLGKKIYILSDDEDCKKEDLIRIVESHGGKHVENLGKFYLNLIYWVVFNKTERRVLNGLL